MKNFLFLLILLSSNKTCNQSDALPFIRATSQAYAGGAAGSGYGTYYTIYMGMSPSPDLQFDSLWVDDRRLPVSIKQNESKNDTLVLFSNDFRMHHFPNDTRNLPEDPKPVAFPITTTAQGVLGYFYKGNRQYFPVLVWTKLKAISYP